MFPFNYLLNIGWERGGGSQTRICAPRPLSTALVLFLFGGIRQLSVKVDIVGVEGLGRLYGIDAVKASGAEGESFFGGKLLCVLDREISNAIRAKLLCDLLHISVVSAGDKLVGGVNVCSVIAGADEGGRGYAEEYF